MRLIDADALGLTDMEIIMCNGDYKEALKMLLNKIDRMPTIEERKTGKWINAYPDIEPNPMFMYGVCSICGYEQSISDKLKFCPNCGARMNI